MVAALAEADRDAGRSRRGPVARCLDGWARLGALGRDPIESYACYRVGYHRGLDRLRGQRLAGERLRALGPRVQPRVPPGPGGAGGDRRRAIGEVDEHERCSQFLRQLDPAWPPPDLGG